jgi:hypothetical protein
MFLNLPENLSEDKAFVLNVCVRCLHDDLMKAEPPSNISVFCPEGDFVKCQVYVSVK